MLPLRIRCPRTRVLSTRNLSSQPRIPLRIVAHTRVALPSHQRFYANAAKPKIPKIPNSSSSSTPRSDEQARRLARQAIANSKEHLYPPKLLIYHAGTTRTTFTALFKVTTLLIGAFFIGIVTPTYIRSEKPLQDTAQVIVFGLLPPIGVALITAPFVTHVHVHLPPQARVSAASLERFVRGGLEGAEISLTTMSLIAKPRVSRMGIAELVPARKRLGIVNFVRKEGDALRELRERRKWYMFRPVTNFYVQEGRPGQKRRVRYQDKKPDRTEWWIWEHLRGKIEAGTGKTA